MNRRLLTPVVLVAFVAACSAEAKEIEEPVLTPDEKFVQSLRANGIDPAHRQIRQVMDQEADRCQQFAEHEGDPEWTAEHHRRDRAMTSISLYELTEHDQNIVIDALDAYCEVN